MSDDRFAADPDRMRQSAQRLTRLQGRVARLSTTIDQLTTRYPNAAGDGDFKESYDANYVPAADAAKQLMVELTASVETVAEDTTTVARDFARTEDDATAESRHQR